MKVTAKYKIDGYYLLVDGEWIRAFDRSQIKRLLWGTKAVAPKEGHEYTFEYNGVFKVGLFDEEFRCDLKGVKLIPA